MLSDKGILELNELCNALVDETLTESQRSRLGEWLARSEDARQFYVRAMALSAGLCQYASEMHADGPDVAPQPRARERAWLWWTAPLAAAACFAVALLLLNHQRPSVPVAETRMEDAVARLTGARECRWANGIVLSPGDTLRRGQRLELERGLAEITFDSGAQVVLEGPAALELASAWDTTLRHGALKASVPQEAIGFSIGNEAVEVVDLGTEFTMIAYKGGAADVLVLKGEVEATPRGPGSDSILIRENEARRFEHSGVTDVSDRERKFARFTQPVPLERSNRAFRYVHWTLDETEGEVLGADDFAGRLDNFDAQLQSVPKNGRVELAVEGRMRHALRFDGQVHARAPFAGISEGTPHTVAFWVKVPNDGQLSSAYAMVAWWAENKQPGSRPVHIGWNRNPNEGPLGVLRTDYGRGYALGSTPLRDGRWHHVAVVFVPSADDATLPEVKQYVDGRLEGEGQPSPPGGGFSTQVSERVRNAVWLGCRLGDTGPRRERFRGELDELCIVEGALGPLEIVQLMKENKPLPAEMAVQKQSP
jgi:ferric-dicitrate binding protein FerR (iron transport regulator)